MKYLRQLAKIEMVALATLLLVAIVLAAFSALQASLANSSVLGGGGSAEIVFGYICVIGCIPVIAFGAPLYAALRYFGKASWFSALAIGIAPGLVLLVVAADLGLWAISCGAVVALATHAICRPGSNNSFEADGSAAAQLQR